MNKPTTLMSLEHASFCAGSFHLKKAKYDHEIYSATYRYMAGENAFRRYKYIDRYQLSLVKVTPHLPDPCTKELKQQIEDYTESVDFLTKQQGDLVNQLLVVHKKLASNNKHAGKIRQQQNHLRNRARGVVSYTPPRPEDVLPLMQDLGSFFYKQEFDVLEKQLIGHAQLACIHPFMDGNGRTARALFDSQLLAYQLPLVNPVLYRWKGRFVDYKSSIQAIRTSPNGVISHPFWKDAISWANNLYIKGIEAKQTQKGKLATKLLMAPLSPLARQVADSLWHTPIVTPEYLTQTYNLNLLQALNAIDELVKTQILKPRVLKLPQYTQQLFELEEKFAFYDVIDRELQNRQEEMKGI